MLFLHETHRVKGVSQDDFEAAFRDVYLPALAGDGGVRLLWYLNHAHGSSISFNVVTITALAGWEAWWGLAERVRAGDLAAWARELDGLRYGSEASLLAALDWSPLHEVDIDGVPTSPGEPHALTMYVEDSVEPDRGDPADALAAIGKLHSAFRATENGAPQLTKLTASFVPVAGAGRRRSCLILQEVLDLDLLAESYAGSNVAGLPWSGGHDEPPLTDTWRTRMLRAAPWSPLW
jgi:hypothetical protein